MVYRQIWLSDTFHRFPHINLSFQLTNSTFDPESAKYVETLLFLAVLPVIWVILTWMVLSIIFCCTCRGKKKIKKQKSTTCLRVVLAMFTFLCGGAVIAGFYGNEETNRGVNAFVDRVEDTSNTIDDALLTIETIDGLATNITDGVKNIKAVFNNSIENYTILATAENLLAQLVNYTNQMRQYVSFIRKDTDHVKLKNVASITTAVETYRWIGSLVLFSWHALLCLLLLIAVLIKSRCLLIFCIVTTFISLLLIWAAGGFYLGVAVGTGDFCTNPNRFVEEIAGNSLERGVLEAYLTCKDKNEPFMKNYRGALAAILKANSSLNTVLKLALPFNLTRKVTKHLKYVREEVEASVTSVSQLGEVASCHHIYDNYIKALNGVCRRGLIGVAFIVLMTAVIGLTLTVVVCLSAQTWRRLGKKRGYYPVDDTDPFLPCPPPYSYGTMPSSPPNDPFSISIRNSYPNIAEASVAEVTHSARGPPLSESPPPAYSLMKRYSERSPMSSRARHQSSEA